MSKDHVLVVAAHPDDEVLGAGGTMALHAARGDEVSVLLLADGVGARGTDEQAVERRKAAALKAATILGTRPPHFLGFADNRLDGMDLLDLIKAIEAVVARIRPTIVYTHNAGDLNIDHAICHRAVLTACRPLPGSTVRRLCAMEVVSSTEWAGPSIGPLFSPNHFVDVSKTWEQKRLALQAYLQEMRDFPHPRSFEALESLGRWRGASVGLKLAEAFFCIRDIQT